MKKFFVGIGIAATLLQACAVAGAVTAPVSPGSPAHADTMVECAVVRPELPGVDVDPSRTAVGVSQDPDGKIHLILVLPATVHWVVPVGCSVTN
jgi:hypothetical protein